MTTTNQDGGEAIMEAFRNLGVDYVISSPGSEWAPVWEALARQQINETPGPRYINCWHETLAVDMAIGYTRVTGRLQAVLLHAGVGLLQGSMGIHSAGLGEVPILVCSGEANSYGENPELDPQGQWYRNLSVVGGPNRFADEFAKWSGQATSPYTLYEQLVRAGELAQRVPMGPAFLDIPIETMIHPWAPPEKLRQVASAPKTRPTADAVEELAGLIEGSSFPLIITDCAGREVQGFHNLVELAELFAIPVIESAATYSNFPKSHPMHLGFEPGPYLERADLVLLAGSRSPWYPPNAGPKNATVVAMGESPIKGQMAYQNLLADRYVEGDLTLTLDLLTDALRPASRRRSEAIQARLAECRTEHDRLSDRNQAARDSARSEQPIDPIELCAAISDVMPEDTVYVEEVTSHRGAISNHVRWDAPHRYFHPNGGLGQGLGLALGVKLAKPEQPVVALMGDGGFLYNPVTQSFGVAREAALPFLTVIFNNGNYEAMRRNHLHYYPDGDAAKSGIYHGVFIPGPNYAQLVEPFGGYGERVEDPANLRQALRNGLNAVQEGRMALIDVVLSR